MNIIQCNSRNLNLLTTNFISLCIFLTLICPGQNCFYRRNIWILYGTFADICGMQAWGTLVLQSGRLVYETSALLASAQCLLVSRTNRIFCVHMRIPSKAHAHTVWLLVNFLLNGTFSISLLKIHWAPHNYKPCYLDEFINSPQERIRCLSGLHCKLAANE